METSMMEDWIGELKGAADTLPPPVSDLSVTPSPAGDDGAESPSGKIFLNERIEPAAWGSHHAQAAIASMTRAGNAITESGRDTAGPLPWQKRGNNVR